jgi:glutamate-1-semialdehyde 2,1-aminomutase
MPPPITTTSAIACDTISRLVADVATPVFDRLDRAFPGGRTNKLVLPGGRRLVIREGRGAQLVAGDGTVYVDYLLSSGPMLLGHGHPRVVEAIRRQLDCGASFHLASEPALELAERVIGLVPCAEQVRFCGSGSEATMFALRIARAGTGRDAILKFEGGFHGNHDAALMSLAPSSATRYPTAEPSSTGIPAAAAADVLIAPFNDLETTARVVGEHARRLAAIIVEPVQRAIPPGPGFLEGLRRLCDANGIVLVFDEVVTGFRLALGGAQERYGVVPDLCALGKALGGGLPIGAVAGSAALMSETAGSGAAAAYMSGTFSGNPLSAAAGLATLDVLSEPGTYDRLERVGETMRAGLTRALAHAGIEAAALGVGPIFQIVAAERPPASYREFAAADAAVPAALAGGLIDRGFLYTGAKGYLSLAHTDDQLERTIEAAGEVARKEIR